MKHQLQLLVLLVAVLLAQSAFAFYNPQAGRWLNRDPIEEKGGKNLLAFIENQSAAHFDANGLFKAAVRCNSARIATISAAESRAVSGAAAAASVLDQSFHWWQVEDRNSRFKQRIHPLQDNPFADKYQQWRHATAVTLGMINRGFAENQYKVECECFCLGDKLAYVSGMEVVYGLDFRIHFCPAFFKLSAGAQADTFLHEASHLLAYTDDLALGGARPWERNPQDAYWIEPLATTDAFQYFETFVLRFTVLFP